MRLCRFLVGLLALTSGLSARLPAVQDSTTPGPEASLVALITSFLARNANTEWAALDRLRGSQFGPPNPTELRTCLPDGSCYTRPGSLRLAGKTVNVAATGARSIVTTLLVRNPAPFMGEAKVLDALNAASITTTLARCPAGSGAGSTNWYRLAGETVAGFLAIQTTCAGAACEGFTLSRGDRLPNLSTAQAALYSESCNAGEERKPITAAGAPHELLAETLRILIPAAAVPAVTWAALLALPTGITWNGTEPKPMSLTFRNDPNPLGMTGSVTLSGREFSVLVSGTASQAQVVYLDEIGLHARGEHMLGVLYQKGFAVQLVRCGPPYSESTHMWYGATSPRTRPVMVLQSIRYDGNRVQDGYSLRLDGTLPARDPRDRTPGSNGC